MALDAKAIEVESEFAIEELFFSTTDSKGVITAGNSVRRNRGADARNGAEERLPELLASCGALFDCLDGIFHNLDRYALLHQKLAGKSTFVLDLAQDIRLSSLNAVIAAARLDEGGATLGAVASLMQARSARTADRRPRRR